MDSVVFAPSLIGLLSPGGPLAPTLLTSGSSSVGGTTQDTASIVALPGRVLLAAVGSCVNAATPTCGGLGLTWVQVNSAVISTFRRMTVFRAIGTPTTGAVTFTWATSQTSAVWNVIQFANADTSGVNGAGAVVQTVKLDSQSAATSVTNTLATFGSSKNVHLAYVLHRTGTVGVPNAVTPDPQFAELAETSTTSDTITMEVQWARNEEVCMSSIFSDQHAMLSIEVKAA